MRGDKGKRGEGERDRGESVGDRGRIVRILERHGDGRRGDTVVGLSWTWRAGEGEREGERERARREETRRGGRREPGEISSRSRFLGTRGPLARLLQSVFARSIFRIRLGSCSFCSTGRASPSWPR